jgi:dihydrofolate reductase
MADLVYFASSSLDGYINDPEGGFGWAEPSAELHRFVNQLQRGISTQLLGRASYEVMLWWEDMGASDPEGPELDASPEMAAAAEEFGEIWRASDKVVYSTTLERTTTARTRLERRFDPDAVRELKAEATGDLCIGGARLAAHAITAGLVDEFQLVLNPVIVGGGTPSLPDGVRLDLELVEQRRFDGDATFLRYRAVR